MGRLVDPIRFLNDTEMHDIHGAALRILDEVGMWIDSDLALEYLDGYGCRVEFDSRMVTFPTDVIQGTVDRMREAPQRSPPDPAADVGSPFRDLLLHYASPRVCAFQHEHGQLQRVHSRH